MKCLLACLSVFLIGIPLSSQTWSTEQLNKANTAKDISYLTEAERDAIMYINLARLYPKEFAKYEVANYFGTEKYGDYLKDSEFRKSLLETLNSMDPVNPLSFDQKCYESAKCFAKEKSVTGERGHTRNTCEKSGYAECISYGMESGKDIAMQWLIDHQVESLGHRNICLNSKYTTIGIGVESFPKWDYCAVANLGM